MSIRPHVFHGAAFFFALLFILAASIVSLHRFWQYEVFYYDFGIFDQAIWHVAHGEPPTIDHFQLSGKLIFADHMSPSIFLLSPIYWITNRPEALLLAQAVAVGLSGLVVYAVGISMLSPPLISLAIMISYLLFIGTQNAVITDFHEVTVMMLPLSLTFWALVTGRKKLFFLLFLLTLGFKESVFLVGIGLGIYILLTRREWWKVAAAIITISILWGWATTNVIIPYFLGGQYLYRPDLPPGILPFIYSFFDEPLKRRTLWYSFGTFGLLPLMSPATWPMIIADLLPRFPTKLAFLRWDLGLHYSAQLAPILAFGAIGATQWITKQKRIRPCLPLLAVLLIGNAVFLHWKLHGPLALAYNSAFYAHTKDFGFLDTLVSQVPPGASVMTHNNLAVRFIHKNNTWLLRDGYDDVKPDYIVLDLREGQNPNNFFGVKDLGKLVLFLNRDKHFTKVYATEKQFVYKRGDIVVR